MDAIEAIGLARYFDGVKAVDGVSFSVQEGEIFGLLGPNGAGKTTTVRLLSGQLRPSAGTARVAGFDVVNERHKVKSFINVVFEQQNLYERLSGRENLAFQARLYGVPLRRVDEVLELVGLSKRADERVRNYSNGMKQRLLIARALLNRPRVLFLDEPTKGLDPHIARSIRKLIAELSREGITIFLTTHYMEEAEQLCHRVAFINEGRIVALDKPQTLKVSYGNRKVRALLKDGREVEFSLDDPAEGRRLGELASRGEILTLHSQEATLEEVFVRLTGRGLG